MSISRPPASRGAPAAPRALKKQAPDPATSPLASGFSTRTSASGCRASLPVSRCYRNGSGVPVLRRIFRRSTCRSLRGLVTQSREERGEAFLRDPPKILGSLRAQERKEKRGRSRGGRATRRGVQGRSDGVVRWDQKGRAKGRVQDWGGAVGGAETCHVLLHAHRPAAASSAVIIDRYHVHRGSSGAACFWSSVPRGQQYLLLR